MNKYTTQSPPNRPTHAYKIKTNHIFIIQLVPCFDTLSISACPDGIDSSISFLQTKYQRDRVSTSLLQPCFCFADRTGIDGRVVKALDLRPNGRYSPRGFKPRSIHILFAVSVYYHILSIAPLLVFCLQRTWSRVSLYRYS